jgi:hypothetical protein
MGDFTVYHIGEEDLKYIKETLERFTINNVLG